MIISTTAAAATGERQSKGVYGLKAIKGHQRREDGKGCEYLIKLVGFKIPDDEEWMQKKGLKHCSDILQEYKAVQPDSPLASEAPSQEQGLWRNCTAGQHQKQGALPVRSSHRHNKGLHVAREKEYHKFG